MMDSFRGLVESLAPIKGRKAIILFSGGQSFSQEVTKYVDKVLDEANKNNVAIYGIAASADNSGIAFVKTFADATGGTSIKQTPNLPPESTENRFSTNRTNTTRSRSPRTTREIRPESAISFA